jgi:hypothetical protein
MAIDSLESLCAMNLHYVDGFHLAPYGDESGLVWESARDA